MNDVQQKELDVFLEIKRVLDKNNLTYFLAYGSCIGVIRHRGFIPWDDDIDIIMPRSSYEKFRTQLYKQLPSNLKKSDPEINASYPYLWMKIYDENTTFVEKDLVDYPEDYIGVFVDIFPLDGLPDNGKEAQRFIKKFYFYRRANFWLRRREHSHKVLIWVKRVIQRIIGFSYFACKARQLADSVPFDVSEQVALLTYGNLDIAEKTVFKKEYFCDSDEGIFEGAKVKIPIGYDNYLKQFYGDYLTLPKEEERIKSQHTPAICDMNTPCRFYADQKKNASRVGG